MTPYRSKKLLEAAKDAPRCMSCNRDNDGTVVGCHPNGLRYGKGMSQKAHDLVSYLCHDCHSVLDGRSGSLTRKEKDGMFLNAFYWSTLWLLQEGRLCVK